MNQQNTLTLHRIFNAPPERVFRAFTDADALSKWLAPHGFTAKINAFEPKEGGAYDIVFTNFGNGERYHFKGEYVEILPNKKIRYTDQLCDEHDDMNGLITEKTIEIKPSFMGTEVNITQTGLLKVQPMEACYLDWQQSLYLLERLISVEH